MGFTLDFSATVVDIKNLGGDTLNYMHSPDDDLTDVLVDLTKFCADAAAMLDDLEEDSFSKVLAKFLGVPALMADLALIKKTTQIWYAGKASFQGGLEL